MPKVAARFTMCFSGLRRFAARTALSAAAAILLLSPPAGAATVNVAIKDNSFNPKSVSVAVGDTVLWTNQGSNTHTATSGSGCTPSGLFNSGSLSPGATYSFTFTTAGSVPYFCIPHCALGMTGTVNVQSAATLACTAMAAPISGPAPLTVAFAATATGGTAPYTFAWDFGDGQSSAAASVSHTYTNAGIYNWSMTATDAAAATCMKTGKISVQAALACAATASPASGAVPLPVSFSGSASGGSAPYGLLWDFGDGETSTASTITHTYASAGSYHWTFTVTDQNAQTCVKGGSIDATAPSTLACSAQATPEGGAPPLTVSFAASATGGTSPYGYAWTFGDGGTGTGPDPTHTYASAGSYTWRVTVTDAAGGSCQSENLIVVAAVGPQAFLSSAARASGAQGTNWRTDAMFYNPGGADLSFVLYYTPAGADGTATPYSHAGVLTPGAAALLPNMVETLFGLTNSAGGIRILASGPLKVTSRTYNDTGAGTYGQFAPGQAAAEAVSASVRAGTDGELIGLNQGDRFRTNLGFSEVAGTAATVVVHFYDSTGASLGSDVTFPLPPYSWSQQSLVQLGLASAVNVRAEVKVQGAGAVLAYASEVDNNTGDAIFMPAQRPADVAGLGGQLIATIAKAQGGFGTNWLTDLFFYNPSAGPQTVSLDYRSPQGDFTASFPLAAGELKAVTDAVATLFPGAGSSTAGALHIASAQGLILASRTYNQASPTQTYGQYVPALAPGGLVASGAGGDILQVTQNADFRTNIGLSDFSGSGASVQVALYDLQGNRIGLSDPLTVPPGGNLQQGITAMFGNSPLFDAGRAVITVLSGGPVYGYASVVDNRTGDAVFIPAKP